MKRFEYIDHTADIAIKAYGFDLAEAFAAAAEGLMAVITGEAELSGGEPDSFEYESIDQPGLLVGMLSELIVRHEVEGVVMSEFDVELLDGAKLRCSYRKQPFDKSQHGEGIHVKGVAYHMLEMHEGGAGEPSHVQVLFDI